MTNGRVARFRVALRRTLVILIFVRNWALGIRSWLLAVLLLAVGAGVAQAQSAGSGLILERAGQLERALEEYRLVLDRNPQDRPAYDGFLRLGEQLGQLDTLVAVSRRLARQYPDRSDFSCGLVGGLLALKRTSEARVEARRAAEKWPDRLAQLAEVFAKNADFASAIEYYEQAREKGGDAFSIADRLIDLRLSAGKPGPAAREIASALDTSPHMLDHFRQKLSAAAVRGGAAVAGELNRIQDLKVRDRALAVVYLATGREAEAVRVLKPVLTAPEFHQFARECEAQGALRAALAAYQELNAHVDAARVLRLTGRVREAKAELAMDNGIEAQFELGELQRDQREFGSALESYQRVLSRQPRHEPASFGLAAAFLGLGRTETARAAARKSGTLSDRLLLLLARTFFYEGQFDSAGACVSELVKRFPQSNLANDGLELAVMTASGDRARELARLLLAYETGAVDTGRVRALSEGDDPVAEQSLFLLARFLSREQRPKDALAVLDRYRQRFATSALAPRARLEQAVLYLEGLKDEARYRETLEQLIVEYPGSAYVPIARSLRDRAARPFTAEGIR